jgi:hypothetical protein
MIRGLQGLQVEDVGTSLAVVEPNARGTFAGASTIFAVAWVSRNEKGNHPLSAKGKCTRI